MRARCSRESMWTAALVACVSLGSACVPDQAPEDPRDPDFYDPGEQVPVTEPIEFTDQNYDVISGDLTIAELRDLRDESAFVWYGYAPGDPYPFGAGRALGQDCSPVEAFENVVSEVPELPATIEGVVTLHPRLLRSPRFCAGEDRFYGTYYIQDETAGVMVYKNSRIADFTFGDRVSLRVRGISAQKFSSMPAGVVGVTAYDSETVVDRGNPIYYEATDQNFVAEDVGKVKRVTGRVVTEPTNQNFNALAIEHADTGAVWSAQIDRELSRRGVPFSAGETVQLTGPVADSFGLTMIIYSLGQIERFDD